MSENATVTPDGFALGGIRDTPQEIAHDASEGRDDAAMMADSISLAIGMLDGNVKPIDWRYGEYSELLRKLGEHLEAFVASERECERLRERVEEEQVLRQQGWGKVRELLGRELALKRERDTAQQECERLMERVERSSKASADIHEVLNACLNLDAVADVIAERDQARREAADAKERESDARKLCSEMERDISELRGGINQWREKWIATQDAMNDAKERERRIAEHVHYPECWDTMAYPTLADAVLEITKGCDPSQCTHAATTEGGAE